VAGEPKDLPREDTAPYELRLPIIGRIDRDAPTGRAPEREPESPGSKLYKIAAPLLGQRDAEAVKQIANLIDSSSPVVAEALAQAWGRQTSRPSQTAGTSMTAQQPGLRGSTAAVVVLASALAAILVALVVGSVVWASTLRSDVLARSRDQDEAIATVRLESTEKAALATGRQDAQDKQQLAMQARLDQHDQQIADHNEIVATLTRHFIGRSDAIGKATGADRLDSWTPTPASLQIIALRADVDDERAKKKK
jgi:hypothetical protein